jgi:Cu-Zn family superoxide dismutase
MLKICKYFFVLVCFLIANIALAAGITVPMNFTAKTGVGKAVGTVVISETKYGLLFTPHLHDLTPGVHGFHVHQNPACDDNGMAAGGHLDPHNTGKHLGPYNDQGHLGDLPVLVVAKDGTATLPTLAPRLHLSDVENHSLMIHDGGDNYSDMPAKLGGGGGRMVCGVIK